MNDSYVICVLIFFIKTCIVGTHLNYLDKFIQEDQWSCSSPETICSEQAYGNILKNKMGNGSWYSLKNLWSLYPTVAW